MSAKKPSGPSASPASKPVAKDSFESVKQPWSETQFVGHYDRLAKQKNAPLFATEGKWNRQRLDSVKDMYSHGEHRSLKDFAQEQFHVDMTNQN